MAFDCCEGEVVEVNLSWTRKKMKEKQTQPPNNVFGQSADRTEAGGWMMGDFPWTFIIVMSQNGQGTSFAGWCGNVHVHSTYGKIEGNAGG